MMTDNRKSRHDRREYRDIMAVKSHGAPLRGRGYRNRSDIPCVDGMIYGTD